LKHLVGLVALLWLPVAVAHGDGVGTTVNPGPPPPGGGAAFAQAQLPGPGPAQVIPMPTAPATGAPTPPAPAGRPPPLTERITVPAGTGMLLKLPQPAASVMSADPTVARVQPASPTSLFLMGVEGGHTNIIATNDNGEAIVQYDVTVTRAGKPTGLPAAPAPTGPTYAVTASVAATIQRNITRSVTGAGGVRVRAVGNDVELSGAVPTAAAAQQAEAIARAFMGEKSSLIDQLTVLSSIQVNVRVRIAEISRSLSQQLGFNWQVLGANGFAFGLRTGSAVAANINPLLPLGIPGIGSGPPPAQIGAGWSSRHWDVNGVIDAMAASQLITVLAEPNLTAQSGETASFLVGGEFPIPVAGSSGVGNALTITVEYKTFGVSLALVPTVLSPSRLNLRVRPEVSQLSTQGAVSLPLGTGTLSIPALTVRRAETTIELGSGQSFAIAGLLEKTALENVNAVPLLGSIPVLGRLFQSNDFQRGETELVIIVTPYLVQPAANPSVISAPAGSFRPATDLDRFLFDRQLAPFSYSRGPTPTLDAGFILK